MIYENRVKGNARNIQSVSVAMSVMCVTLHALPGIVRVRIESPEYELALRYSIKFEGGSVVYVYAIFGMGASDADTIENFRLDVLSACYEWMKRRALAAVETSTIEADGCTFRLPTSY